MKKTGLFKIIMFTLLGILLVTWFVPASYFTDGNLSSLGMNRVGFFDFFQLLFGTFGFAYFIQIFILLVSIGALYGVLVKTGKYGALIEKIASKFKGKEQVFLIAAAFLIAALTSVFDYGLLLFIFIPAIISIILAMGYDKITACITTFGAILIGTIGTTLGYNIVGVINEQINGTLTTALPYKIGMFVLCFAALVVYLLKVKKTNKVDKEDAKTIDMFAGEKISNKYSVAPIIVIFSILFVLLIMGCTAWNSTFGINVFTDFNTKVSEVSIKGFAIFGNLLGTVNAFGNWYYAEMTIMCLLAALLLGRFYRMKHRDMFSYMAQGAKNMLAPALMIVLVYAVIYFAGNTMFYPTIADFILKATSKFNIFFSTIAMILGSALHVDMLYVASYVIPQLAAQDVNTTVLAVLIQGIYGVTMFVAPTSVILVLGLSYLNIPYKEWIKKTWKLALVLFAIVMVALILAAII
mgnify:FL=1